MGEIFKWYVLHLTGGGLWKHVQEGTTDWGGIGWLSVGWLMLTTLIVTINFIMYAANTWRDSNFYFSFPILLIQYVLYNIVNIIINLIILGIGLTVGGFVGLGIIGVSWIILVSAVNFDYLEDGELPGVFGIMEWTFDFNKKLAEYVEYRKDIKRKYKHFLEIKY